MLVQLPFIAHFLSDMPINTNPVSGQLYVAVLLKMVSGNTTKRPPNESIGTLRGPQSTTAQEKLNTIIKKLLSTFYYVKCMSLTLTVR